MKSTLYLGVIAVLLTSCGSLTGEEIGRLSFEESSNETLNVEEITLNLNKGDRIQYWSDMDISYKRSVAMVYYIELWRDSVNLGGFEGNALDTNPTLMETKTTVGGTVNWSFTGRMFASTIKEDGEYTIKAILRTTEDPSLELTKADLILKK